MRFMNLGQMADYLESAEKIKQTINAGHAIVHIGTSAEGFDFVLVNDCFENTVLTESM